MTVLFWIQVVFLAVNGKLGLLTSLFQWLQAFQAGVVDKIVSIGKGGNDDEEVGETEEAAEVRYRRNAGPATEGQLMRLLSGVLKAIEKHE